MILTYYCIITMIIIAYLLGSIPSAVWIGKKYYGIDIREHGSKNAGTTNMLRVLGRRAALPVFLLDFLKGFVAVTLTEILKYDAYINDMWLINIKIIAVFAAVLGHIFPIFAGFRGGKGVATLVGAITGIYPPVVLLCFAVWVVILMMTHYVSLASIVAGCCFPIFTIVSPKVNQSVPFIVFSFVTAVLLLYTHRKNIVRLKNGTESYGNRVKAKVVKNKVAPPFKKAEFDIMFGEGISKIGEIIDLGVDYGIIKKSGSWFSYGDRKIGQGRDSVKELLKNDEALRNEVEAKVREAMIAARKA